MREDPMKALKSIAAGIACLSLVMALASCPSPTDPAAPPTPTTTASNNAFLSKLNVKVGDTTNDIGFQATTYAYTYNVATTVASVTVNAVPVDDEAGFEGGGVVTLNDAGESTTVPIVVTAANGTTKKTYTVTIKRAAAGASDNTDLSDLSISYVGSATNMITFDATKTMFDAGPRHYGFSLANISATAADSGATIRGAGIVPVAVGPNDFCVIVTAADGVHEKPYTISVNRNDKESNNLSSLSVSGLSFTLTGDYLKQYFFTAPNLLETATIQAAAEYSGSTVTIDSDGDGTFEAFSGSAVIALEAGVKKTVVLRVTPEYTGDVRNYTVNITRAVADALSEASLSSLVAAHKDGTPYTLSSTFDAGTTAYTVSVPSYESSVKIQASAVAPMNVKSGEGSYELAVGTNIIPVVALAADGVTTKTYTITVMRATPPTITITSPTTGATITAGSTTFTGSLSDPNGEATGLCVSFGLATVNSAASNGAFSIDVDTSVLTNGSHVFDFVVMVDDEPIASISRPYMVQGGATGHTATVAIMTDDGRSSLSGYLSVLYEGESFLVSNTAVNCASLPYQLTMPGLPDGDYEFVYIVFSEEPYIVEGEFDLDAECQTFTVAGADIDVGTVYLSGFH